MMLPLVESKIASEMCHHNIYYKQRKIKHRGVFYVENFNPFLQLFYDDQGLHGQSSSIHMTITIMSKFSIVAIS